MQPQKFRHLAWQFNHFLDAGEHDDITPDEVLGHIEADSLANFLTDYFDGIDLSVMQPKDWEALTEEWSSFANAIDASRNFGVRKKGLSLLLAYAMESLQLRRFDESEARAA